MDSRFDCVCVGGQTIVLVGKIPSVCLLRNFAYICFRSTLSPIVDEPRSIATDRAASSAASRAAARR